MKKYFGTDGIRGRYGKELTDEIAYFTGNCIGKMASGGLVVIGRDTRLSGTAIFVQIAKGVLDAGSQVIDLGVISTPAVAYITSMIYAKFGIVISASHNPKEYNGIKIFNHEGRKLLDSEEEEIENFIDKKGKFFNPDRGLLFQNQDAIEKYFHLVKKAAGNDLSGLKVVLDCANGAVSLFAPRLFSELGAEVVSYFDSGDGAMINHNCGALFPEVVASKVVENNADLGFCFDGDADRIIAVNKKGEIVDGDSIIYIISKYLKEQGRLNKDSAVGTLHTNMGVEKSLNKLGIKLFRTDIGDHYVMEKMVNDDLLVGGEQSGHIILREFINTGDGLLTAMYLAHLVKITGKMLDELDDSEHFVQVNVNVVTEHKKEIMNDEGLLKLKKELEKKIEGKGRILLRASGTEPKVRIMVEGDSRELCDEVAGELQQKVSKIIERIN